MGNIIRITENDLIGIIENIVVEETSLYQQHRRDRMKKNVTKNNNQTNNNPNFEFGNNIQTDLIKRQDDALKKMKNNIISKSAETKKEFLPIPTANPKPSSEPTPTQKVKKSEVKIYTDFDRNYDYYLNDNGIWLSRKKPIPAGKWYGISHNPSAVNKLNKRYGTKGRIVSLSDSSKKPNNLPLNP